MGTNGVRYCCSERSITNSTKVLKVRGSTNYTFHLGRYRFLFSREDASLHNGFFNRQYQVL